MSLCFFIIFARDRYFYVIIINPGNGSAISLDNIITYRNVNLSEIPSSVPFSMWDSLFHERSLKLNKVVKIRMSSDGIFCFAESLFRPQPHTSPYFLSRNFFIPDTASVHTHSANSDIFFNVLSRVVNNKSGTNPITRGQEIFWIRNWQKKSD